MMRQAISPRLAIRRESNIAGPLTSGRRGTARSAGGLGGGECEAQADHVAGLGGLDDAVVPQARGRVIGIALLGELGPRRAIDLGDLGVVGARLQAAAPQVGQHGRGDVGAHRGDARVRPGEQEARVEAAAAHAVVAGAERAADDHRQARHARSRHRVHELRAVAGDAAALGLGADHEAGDVLQEQQRDVALVAQLDEMRALERRFGEQHAVVGQDADRIAAPGRGAADQRRAELGLELLQLRIVDQARDHLAHIDRAASGRPTMPAISAGSWRGGPHRAPACTALGPVQSADDVAAPSRAPAPRSRPGSRRRRRRACASRRRPASRRRRSR